MRLVRGVAAATALAVALVLLPGSAQAAWAPARPMDQPGWTAADEVAIAVARNGSAVTAWAGWPPDPKAPAELRVRRISAAGHLGRVLVLSRPESSDPAHISVAVDADGDALVAWAAYDHAAQAWQVWARRLSRDGVPGPSLRMSQPTDSSWLPVAALTPRGKGAVVYDDGLQQVLRRVSRRSHVGRAIRLVEQGGFGGRLVATRDGDFVTAGTDADGVVVAYRLLPDGRLLSRKLSAGTPMSDSITDIGVDRRGTAHLTYRAADADGIPHPALWTRTWAPDRRLGPARRVAPRAHDVVRATSRTDLEGDTLVAWSRLTPPATVTLYGRVVRQDGSMGPVRRLGLIEAADVYHPVPSPAPGLAVDDDGDGVVVWPSEPELDHLVTWARRVRRDGSVGAKVMLRDTARPHAVGITPGGRARIGITTQPGRLLLRTGP